MARSSLEKRSVALGTRVQLEGRAWRDGRRGGRRLAVEGDVGAPSGFWFPRKQEGQRLDRVSLQFGPIYFEQALEGTFMSSADTRNRNRSRRVQFQFSFILLQLIPAVVWGRGRVPQWFFFFSTFGQVDPPFTTTNVLLMSPHVSIRKKRHIHTFSVKWMNYKPKTKFQVDFLWSEKHDDGQRCCSGCFRPSRRSRSAG